MRTNGLIADVSVIEFTEGQFANWLPVFDPTRFQRVEGLKSLPEIVSQINAEIPSFLQFSGEPVPYRSDLSFVKEERDSDGGMEQDVVRVASLFLFEIQIVEGDQFPEIYRVSLNDIRRFYEDYGQVTADINVLGRDGEFLPARLRRGSLFPVGGEQTLRETFAFLLSRLPGKPELAEFPKGFEKLRRELKLWGALPKRVLRQLLSDYGLLLFERFGFGRIGDACAGLCQYRLGCAFLGFGWAFCRLLSRLLVGEAVDVANDVAGLRGHGQQEQQVAGHLAALFE